MAKENDLELYSNDDLVNELKRRFEHTIFAGRGKRIKGKGEYDFDSFAGNWLICWGLCEKIKYTIGEDYKENSPEELKVGDI